jgi:hypothetical protein
MSQSLYDLTEDLVSLNTLLEEVGGDVSEGTEGQTLEKWALEFDWKMRSKVDAYGGLYKNMDADVVGIKAEIKRLGDRARALENRKARLLALAKFSMERLGTRKLEGVKFTIAIQKNGGVEPMEVLVESVAMPEPFRVEEKVYKVDTDLLRTALEQRRAAVKAGQPHPFPDLGGKAVINDRGESVHVRWSTHPPEQPHPRSHAEGRVRSGRI